MISEFARDLANQLVETPLDPSEAEFFSGILKKKESSKRKKSKKAANSRGTGILSLGFCLHNDSQIYSERPERGQKRWQQELVRIANVSIDTYN